MRPRWVATIVAAFALLLLLGRDVYEQPEHYRVQLDVPPVDAALWFVARYPQYFTSGETELAAWLEQLPERDRVFVLAMAQTLAWAWVDHELQRLDRREPTALAGAATIVIRDKTLNQLEIDFDHHFEQSGVQLNAQVGDPLFAAGVFARLVRGASNCEGQNHLVGLLIETALHDTMGIEAELAGVPGHDLVRLRGLTLAQPIYVDAWSNLRPFCVDPSLPAAAPLLDPQAGPMLPGVAGRAPFAAAEYQRGGGVVVKLVPERDAPAIPVSLAIRPPKLDPASLAKVQDPWRIYLYARILHIYDDPRAADLYRVVLDGDCKTQRPWQQSFECEAAAALLERLPG